MTKERLSELIDSYLTEVQTAPEREELSAALEEGRYAAQAKDIIHDFLAKRQFNYGPDLEPLYARIEAAVAGERTPVHFLRRIHWVAAAVFIMVLVGTYFLLHKNNSQVMLSQAERFKNDIAPGHQGAVLTLSNGTKIILDSAGNGALAKEGNIEVIKDNGQITYDGKNGTVLYNDVKTDKSRQWQLTLSDGTKVWLNAASSIHYPNTFTGNERVVEITGEAYFAVVHNSKMPFRVKVAGQVIEDVGTEFNINAYDDEPAVKTTLLEGSVRVITGKSNTLLKPGQQAVLVPNQDGIRIAAPDPEQVVAWKNGFFNFKETRIEEIMRQLERWYDIKVEYKGKIEEPFIVEVPRNVPVSTLLRILESTGWVKFTIEGKTVTVMP